MGYRINPFTSKFDYSKNTPRLVNADPASGKDGDLILNEMTGEMKEWFGGSWQLLHTLTDSRSYMLKEDGDFMLTESGYKIILD